MDDDTETRSILATVDHHGAPFRLTANASPVSHLVLSNQGRPYARIDASGTLAEFDESACRIAATKLDQGGIIAALCIALIDLTRQQCAAKVTPVQEHK